MSKFSLISCKADRVLGMTAVAVASVTGAGLVGNAPEASADIVYSGTVNIIIPDTIDGIYVNLITNAANPVPPVGWDINMFSGDPGEFNLWGPTAAPGPFLSSGVTPGFSNFVWPTGTVVGPAGTYLRDNSNIASQIGLNARNYFGVQFRNESGSTNHFGWVEVTFGASIANRSITGYAYQSTPGTAINIGAIPEPGALSVLALGAVGLFARRRRTA